jgi:hypothetical protein
MQRLLIICLLLTVSMGSFSQKKADLSTAGTFVLDVGGEKYEGKEKIPFKDIIVRDYRFDSTKLGYINNRVRKIVLKNTSSLAFTSALSEHYKDVLNPAAEKSLVIILKSYWLQRGFYDVNADNTVRLNEFSLEDDQTGVCIADFEIFSSTGDGYKALLKLEYEFELSSYKKKKLDGSFFVPFDSLIRRINSMNVDDVLSRKKSFTWSVLQENYSKRFEIPVLKVAQPTRGVFMSFNDFRENKTIYPDFTVKEGKVTDHVYINGDQLLTEFWGFFDGRDFYLKIGYSFYKMIRQNNTFDLLGPKKPSKYTTSTPAMGYNSGMSYPTTSIRLDPRPLQLDMENGEVY